LKYCLKGLRNKIFNHLAGSRRLASSCWSSVKVPRCSFIWRARNLAHRKKKVFVNLFKYGF